MAERTGIGCVAMEVLQWGYLQVWVSGSAQCAVTLQREYTRAKRITASLVAGRNSGSVPPPLKCRECAATRRWAASSRSASYISPLDMH
jgi:hypothetical protein